ncbi:MAG: hypothetical protein [Caudoviricetes sp.]|nr:MAG: hypothetical protein [Caudoviricetes sp.]
MSKIILTVGPSASGKSTWASDYARKNKSRVVILNRDDIRRSMFSFSKWSDYKFKKSTEALVTKYQQKMAIESLDAGFQIIIADTNLNPKYREYWKDLAKSRNICFEIEKFDVSLDKLIRFNRERLHSIDEKILKEQYYSFQRQFCGLKTYVPNLNLPDAVIFDLDGTLAEMNDRGPFEWDKVGTDTVRSQVAELFRMIRKTFPERVIITLSGRDGVCEQLTKDWLKDNVLESDVHIQRKPGDMRKDSIIKSEIFWRDIAPNYNVLYAVDDRQQVVDMWNSIGVQVWQVAQNDI